jgi:hypothetical protein
LCVSLYFTLLFGEQQGCEEQAALMRATGTVPCWLRLWEMCRRLLDR